MFGTIGRLLWAPHRDTANSERYGDQAEHAVQQLIKNPATQTFSIKRPCSQKSHPAVTKTCKRIKSRSNKEGSIFSCPILPWQGQFSTTTKYEWFCTEQANKGDNLYDPSKAVFYLGLNSKHPVHASAVNPTLAPCPSKDFNLGFGSFKAWFLGKSSNGIFFINVWGPPDPDF